MKKLTIFLGMTLLSACSNFPPELVVMQNAKTKEVTQCKHDPWGSISREDVRNCVEGYKAAGWMQLSPPPDTQGK